MNLSAWFSEDDGSFEPVVPSDKIRSLSDKGNCVSSMLFIIFIGDLNNGIVFGKVFSSCAFTCKFNDVINIYVLSTYTVA